MGEFRVAQPTGVAGKVLISHFGQSGEAMCNNMIISTLRGDMIMSP